MYGEMKLWSDELDAWTDEHEEALNDVAQFAKSLNAFVEAIQRENGV